MSECSVRIELGTGTIVQQENVGFVKVEEEQEFEPLTPSGTFGWAIEAMKRGERFTRRGWNGKKQYIELATNISYKNAKGEIVNVNHENIGNKAIAFVGTSGVQMGWLASQADMLADDWEIFA